MQTYTSFILDKSSQDILNKVSNSSGIDIQILKQLLSLRNSDGNSVFNLAVPEDFFIAIGQIRDNFNNLEDIIRLSQITNTSDFLWETSYFNQERYTEALEADIRLDRQRVREIEGMECLNKNCKSGRISMSMKQTRSADEPITQFYRCQICTHHWKV